MPRGFFDLSTVAQSKQPVSRIPKCGACGLYKTCLSPKMAPSGKGRKRILIIGEAPGKNEDSSGRQFAGRIGQLLESELRKNGIDLRRDCIVVDSVICAPPDNRDPTESEVEYCKPNLLKTVEEHKPDIIIPLGRFGIQSLMSLVWKDDVGSGNRWVGWQIPCQKINAWICPTYHPRFIDRKLRDGDVEGMHWVRHLSAAADLQGRPWDVVPDWENEVECILKPATAAKAIREMVRRGGNVAFDYETNMLKPDADNACIASCSVCWNGKWTIAYPWHGEAIEATGELLASDLGKIASNLKFEERWSMKVFRRRVRNWIWDTMVAAHVLDGRPDITSIKFQSFVLLGAESYDDHIKPLLKAKKNSKINQILDEVDMHKLLRYNGLDSLLEYKVCEIQRRQIGYGEFKRTTQTPV